jgi:hypothetical protein
MGRDCAANDMQNLTHGLGMGSEQVPQRDRKTGRCQCNILVSIPALKITE